MITRPCEGWAAHLRVSRDSSLLRTAATQIRSHQFHRIGRGAKTYARDGSSPVIVGGRILFKVEVQAMMGGPAMWAGRGEMYR